MANNDMVIGQNHDLSLMPDQHFVLGQHHNLILDHGHNFAPGQTEEHGLDIGPTHAHDLDIGQTHAHDLDIGQTHAHDLDMGQTHDNGLDMGHTDDHGEALGLTHEHGMALQHTRVENFGEHGIKLDDQDSDADQEQADIDNQNNELSLTVQNHELILSSNHESPVVENHDLHEMSDLAVDQNEELGFTPDSIMTVKPLLTSPPVLQSRALVLDSDDKLTVGQEFPDVHSCRRALRDAAIALRFEMQTIKSDKTRFTAKCASEGCPWRIHAAKLPGVPTFTIRTIHKSHTCGGITHLGHQQASVQWVAESVEQRLRENPNYKPKEILEEIHRVHGIALSYKQAWRGRERIMAAVRGSFEEDFRRLPQYCDQIRNTNPGSIAFVYGNPADNCFQRLFISFQASIYGFLNACRPLIGLDRTPLKSKYLGTLLLATGFDGDGALFPLAFGVVDEENDDNWMWFLYELHNLLETNAENMPRLTILSDRQKGVVDGVEANFPTAFHGFCMHHLRDSFRKEFNDANLVNHLWEAAHALTILEFEAKILEIEEISRDAAYWIRRVPPRLWATAYFEGIRFGHLTANVAEYLSTWMAEASALPIIQMMEHIRRQLMTWFNERREASMQWTSILVPSAERRVLEAIECARNYTVLRANEAEFEVISHEGSHIVNIRTRCCSCRGWELGGLPCAHAVAALLSCRQNVYRFTETCFTVANYRKAYSQTIHPIPDKALWNETMGVLDNDSKKDVTVIVNPPKSLRPPGRPRKRRARTEDSGRAKRVVHCSRCNQTGHFRTTCTAPI